jgi:MIP family channel proteins
MKAATIRQRALAEFIGTFTLVFAGCGAVMVAERFPGSVAPGTIPMVFGIAIAIMIYAVGHISGGHFNPAVSLGLSVAGQLPKKDLAPYWASQALGALAATALLAALLPAGHGYGATVPLVPAWQAVAWEAVLTFFLVFVILAVATDKRAPAGFAGLAIGATICLDAFVGGPITGASMNPARSLAPALWQGEWGVLWIYFAGPAIGAVVAALTYERLR